MSSLPARLACRFAKLEHAAGLPCSSASKSLTTPRVRVYLHAGLRNLPLMQGPRGHQPADYLQVPIRTRIPNSVIVLCCGVHTFIRQQ
jgi:hypothetical protein